MIFRLFNTRILLASALLIILPSNLFAGMNKFKGKGPLLLSEDMANIVEYYFSGGKKGAYAKEQSLAWKPNLIVIAEDGSDFSYYGTPTLWENNVDTKNYVGMALKDCRKNLARNVIYSPTDIKLFGKMAVTKKEENLKEKKLMQEKLFKY